jgi:hypothetical protein
MLSQAISLLVAAVLAQIVAVYLAARLIRGTGRFWPAWSCLCFALLLMVPQRWRTLELALHSGLYDFTGALFDCAVSLLLLLGMIGLRGLFRR